MFPLLDDNLVIYHVLGDNGRWGGDWLWENLTIFLGCNRMAVFSSSPSQMFQALELLGGLGSDHCYTIYMGSLGVGPAA